MTSGAKQGGNGNPGGDPESGGAEQVRVLIVDDHEVVRQGIKALLEADPDIRVVGEADGVKSAINQAKWLSPDVVVMDVRLADGSGITATREIRTKQPATRVLMLTSFADEEALFGACSAHWLASNPPPDVEAWGQVADPEERLELALSQLYAYYRRTEGMLDKLLRDAPAVPIVDQLMVGLRGLLSAATDALMRGRGLRGNARRRTHAAIGHALAFSTWQQLTRGEELDDHQAVELISRLVAAA